MEDLKTTYDRVSWLVNNVPAARSNYKLLLLLYWQVFDEIDIPKDIVNEIAEKGTEPESINRLKRKALGLSESIEALRDAMLEALDDSGGTE